MATKRANPGKGERPAQFDVQVVQADVTPRVAVAKVYADASFDACPTYLRLRLYDPAKPHLRQPQHFGQGTMVGVQTGITAKAPEGYRFDVAPVLRGYTIPDFDPDLGRVYLYNLASMITVLRHGGEIAVARLVPAVTFAVSGGDDAAQ